MGRSSRKHEKTTDVKLSKMLDNIWVQLKDGAEKIYKKEPMSSQKYMILYSCVYNYCTNVQMKVSAQTSKRETTIIGAQILGLELYTYIKQFIQKYLEELCKVNIVFSKEISNSSSFASKKNRISLNFLKLLKL